MSGDGGALSPRHPSSSSPFVRRALAVVPPPPLSAAGPVALPLLAPAAIVVLGAAVVDVVPPLLTCVSVLVSFVPVSVPVSVSVVVVPAGLLRLGGVRRVLGLLGRAGLMAVVLVAPQQGPVAGLHHQGPVQVGFHVRTDVQCRGEA